MNRTFAHISPSYIKDRVLLGLNQRLYPDHPWITADATILLADLLRPEDISVEFGSGRSTIWFANKVNHLTSIEHNSVWFDIVNHKIEQHGLKSKVDYRLCKTAQEYSEQANSFQDESIDFTLIDGISRDHCAINMTPKIRSGGILAIDNVNLYLPNDLTKSPNSRRVRDGAASPVWKEFQQAVKHWRKIWTSNGIFDTCIWLKP